MNIKARYERLLDCDVVWQLFWNTLVAQRGIEFGRWTWNVIRQGKGQSVVVCGVLCQPLTLRPQTTSVSKASNLQRLETRTSQIQVWSLTVTTNLLCKTWTRWRLAHRICDLHCNHSEHSVLTVIPKRVFVCVKPKGLTLCSCVPDGVDLHTTLLLTVKMRRNCTHHALQ